MNFPNTWQARRARFVFSRRDVRGVAAPLASATKDGVTLRSDLDFSVWNPDSDVSKYKLVEPDDFVIGLRSFQHGISHSTVRGIVSPAYTVLRTVNGLDARFYRHYFRSSLLISHLANITQGIRQGQAIDIEAFQNIAIPVPPLMEQRRIAEFLDAETARLDRIRELSSRQTNLLETHFKEHMRQETSTSSGPTKPTGISWMPEMNAEWQLLKIGREFRTGSGTTPTASDGSYFDGPHYWINSADINDGLISSVGRTVTGKALLEFSALKIHPAGSLAIALYGQGATKGRVGILGVDACLNQACCALTSNGTTSIEFAYYWFRAHKDGIVTQAVGAGQPNLSQELVRELRIPVPGHDEQMKIVERLREADESLTVRTSLLRRRDALLAERRSTLITAAVTGQFDVSTASGRNVTEGV
jgi:type I restriction enzyme S subunit